MTEEEVAEAIREALAEGLIEIEQPAAGPVDLADVSSGLIDAINELFGEYGALGVERAVIAMRARMEAA